MVEAISWMVRLFTTVTEKKCLVFQYTWNFQVDLLIRHITQVLCVLMTDQQYSWSPSQHFNEERYSPAPRNMKGLSGSRNQPQLCSAHTCGLASPEDCEHTHDLIHHGQEPRPSYLLSPTESCPLDHHRCSPRSSIHSECMMMPMVMGDHMSSSTFPRMHYSSHYDSRDDCAMSHGNPKINRIPANLLDQFEKQLPLHRDGFHTLQYQRTSTAAEQRSESPGRIRHLVHSVQKLFTKSHSLEGSSKGNVNGTKGDSRGDDHHHGHHSKHSKRSKSKERKPEGKHKSGMSSWWSSDDNLDSDSTYRTPSVVNRHHADHISHCYPEALQGHFGDLSLKTSKSNNDVKCSACEGLPMTPDSKYMKRSSWSTLTVSQAKEAYRKSSLNLDKPLVHQEIKPSLRPCHYLQVRGRFSWDFNEKSITVYARVTIKNIQRYLSKNFYTALLMQISDTPLKWEISGFCLVLQTTD